MHTTHCQENIHTNVAAPTKITIIQSTFKEGLDSNLFSVSQLFEWTYLAAFLSIDNLKFGKITRHRRFFDL